MGRRALLALGVGGFALGTGEFALMGLLPEVAADTGTTVPTAGRLISAYAVGVALGAPLLAVLTAAWPRRALLVALMLAAALANVATALLPGALAIGIARFMAGLPHGTFFGVAALVAAGLAAPEQRGRAVGLVMLGLMGATLAGVPLAAWLGQQFGWRAAFVLVAALALLAAALIHRALPALPAAAGASPLRELGALARPQVWLTLGIAAIGFGGLFSVYSYIKPLLVEVSGLGLAQVPLALALFGIGGVAANLIGARLADRAVLPTIAGTLAYSALLLAGFGMLAQSVPTALLGVLLLGGTVALGPALQLRLMDVAGDAQTLAAALNHSAFNIANAIGAAAGGAALAAGWGWASLGWVGAALALGGMAVLAASFRLKEAPPRLAE